MKSLATFTDANRSRTVSPTSIGEAVKILPEKIKNSFDANSAN
jgi:hypothetical protein